MLGERGDIESTYNLGIKDVKPRPYSNNYALSVRLIHVRLDRLSVSKPVYTLCLRL